MERDYILQSLSAEDDLGRALRAALLAERIINAFLEGHLEKADLITEGRFSFDQKLRVAEALGYDATLIEVARALNRERNRFAHELDAEFSADNLIQAARSFGKLVPGMFDDILSRLNPSVPRFEDQAPADMLTALALALYTFSQGFNAAALEQKYDGGLVSDLALTKKRRPENAG